MYLRMSSGCQSVTLKVSFTGMLLMLRTLKETVLDCSAFTVPQSTTAVSFTVFRSPPYASTPVTRTVPKVYTCVLDERLSQVAIKTLSTVVNVATRIMSRINCFDLLMTRASFCVMRSSQ